MTVLDWRDRSHYAPRPAKCRRAGCTGRPTHLRTREGVPMHKTCAELEVDRLADGFGAR